MSTKFLITSTSAAVLMLALSTTAAFALDKTVLDNKTVSGLENSAAENPGYGGFMFVRQQVVEVNNSTFSNNKASIDGGVFSSSTPYIKGQTDAQVRQHWQDTIGMDTSSRLIVKNSSFEDNIVDIYSSGAIGAYGDLQVADSKFLRNKVNGPADNPDVEGGGAIYLGGWARADISGTEFGANEANIGGAISTTANKSSGVMESAYLNVQNSDFHDNKASVKGGAIFNALQKADISGSKFANNTAGSGLGGAIANISGKANSNMNIEGSTFNGNSAQMGGALFNSGTLTVSNSTFSGNKAEGSGYGAAIFNNQGLLTVENSVFENNVAAWDGGAISQSTSYFNAKTKPADYTGTDYSEASIRAYWLKKNGFDAATKVVVNNSTFKNNIASEYSGGALGVYSDALISNSAFEGNNAGGHNPADKTDGGGAIYAGGWARLDLSNSVFNKNSSNYGGAIATTRAGMVNGIYMKISGSEFAENTATVNGGAISNRFDDTTITGSVFNKNTAGKNGGAIFNEGGIVFSGENTFSGNKDANGLNDIHNVGTINVADGTLSLDGGISGAGSIVFAQGSNLKVKTNVTTIENSVTTNGANLNLVFDNAYEGQYQLVTGSVTDKDFTIAENSLYNISGVDGQLGTYEISKKGSAEIAKATGANKHQAAALEAMTSGTSNNHNFNQVANKVAELLQSEDTRSEGLKAVSAMSAEVAPLVQATQTAHVNQVFGLVSTRLSGGAVSANQGKSSGDMLDGSALWVQGMINQSKLDGIFNTHTNGIAMGAEKYLNEDVKVGLGYAHGKTDVDSFSRDTEIKSHTALLYGEYKPSSWFVNGIASYTWSQYKEDKNVAGTDAGAKYDADTISLQAVTGYEYLLDSYQVTPTIGLRYVNIDQDGYTDGIGTHVDSENMDILTAMAGVKLSTDYNIDQVTLTPEIRAALTYDLMRDSSNSVVSLANGSAYAVENTNLKRFGYEIGAGLTAAIDDNIEISAAYEGKFRKDYQDHTGLLSAKYHF